MPGDLTVPDTEMSQSCQGSLKLSPKFCSACRRVFRETLEPIPVPKGLRECWRGTFTRPYSTKTARLASHWQKNGSVQKWGKFYSKCRNAGAGPPHPSRLSPAPPLIAPPPPPWPRPSGSAPLISWQSHRPARRACAAPVCEARPCLAARFPAEARAHAWGGGEARAGQALERWRGRAMSAW